MSGKSSRSHSPETSYGAIVICDAGPDTSGVFVTETRADAESDDWYLSWPKGAMEKHDRKHASDAEERETAAILRELEEEAGLSRYRMEFLLRDYVLDYVRNGQNNGHREKRIKLALMVTNERGPLLASDTDRHRRGICVPYTQAAAMLRHPTDREAYRGIQSGVVQAAVQLLRGTARKSAFMREHPDTCEEIVANIAAFRERMRG